MLLRVSGSKSESQARKWSWREVRVLGKNKTHLGLLASEDESALVTTPSLLFALGG